MTGVERGIKRTRTLRTVLVLAVALNAFILAVDAALGSALAFVPAVCIIALLVLVVMQTRMIGTLQRTQRLNFRAEQLELAAQAVRNQARPCVHPDAEPVDLSTGERVAWVCPDPECNADLPAIWTPPAKGTGTLTAAIALTAAGSLTMSGPALSGTGSLSAEASASGCQCADSDVAEVRVPESAVPVARYCRTCLQLTYPPTDLRTDELRAAFRDFKAAIEAERQCRARDWRVTLSPSEAEAERHFAALARVGRESCIGFCPICAERGQS